ncbi:Sensor histidine kinase DesK [Arthrobacter saudimassiliensis]|uniref:histidine kinase n=1 Tax=Arthrobacter saudimassiliensis TaxID=1461584 RepID=A0A078MUU9_9MICC|nr:Sensor histidine kinase DesK [Arthrobacter saudimassiliensis]
MIDVAEAPAPARRSLSLRTLLSKAAMPVRSIDTWERPRPTREQQRRDVLGTLAFVLLSSAVLELGRGIGFMGGADSPIWGQHLALALMVLPLAWRRRFPITVLLASSTLFLVLSLSVPEVSGFLSFQMAYFAAMYSAFAWARDRRLLWVSMILVIAAMALWILLSFTVSSAYDSILESVSEGDETHRGVLPPLLSLALYNLVINTAFFGGAIMFGLRSWRSAHQRQQLREQSAQLAAQSAELARQAVIDERLRIARELHDVVAHHVSVIGVHAGAARRVLDKKPEAAAAALQTIEEASRQGVTEMRSLLGVLRSADADAEGGDGAARRPEPGLAQIPELIEEHRELGLTVRYAEGEDVPGTLAAVPAPLALSIYRTVQESLANVRRHSTAGNAVVALRTGGPDDARWVEVETVDDGRPRQGATGGSGFGLRGIRERAALHRGCTEIGPRADGGWRVRVRFTLP